MIMKDLLFVIHLFLKSLKMIDKYRTLKYHKLIHFYTGIGIEKKEINSNNILSAMRKILREGGYQEVQPIQEVPPIGTIGEIEVEVGYQLQRLHADFFCLQVASLGIIACSSMYNEQGGQEACLVVQYCKEEISLEDRIALGEGLGAQDPSRPGDVLEVQ